MIRVLLADDSLIMLSAMRQVLSEDPRIKVVGEAPSFAATMQAIGNFKPDVLLLDLHLPDSRDLPPAFVKSQLVSVPHTLAVSIANDDEAKSLAESYGAVALPDKMNLYSELIPAIMKWSESTQLSPALFAQIPNPR